MDIDENMSEALYVELLELEDTMRRKLKEEHLDMKAKSWGIPMSEMEPQICLVLTLVLK